MVTLIAAIALASAGQDPTPAPQNPDTRVICRSESVTGTRLHSERVCRTQAEWTAYRQEARRHVEQLQNTRGTSVQDNDLQKAGTGGI